MILKFFRRIGEQRSAAGIIAYLMKERVPPPEWLEGSRPLLDVMSRINGYEHTYADGVLSHDVMLPSRIEILSHIQLKQVLAPGMSHRILWAFVRHTEHKRTENHFLAVKGDLLNGMSYEIYYKKSDFERCWLWARIFNATQGLSEPIEHPQIAVVHDETNHRFGRLKFADVFESRGFNDREHLRKLIRSRLQILDEGESWISFGKKGAPVRLRIHSMALQSNWISSPQKRAEAYALKLRRLIEQKKLRLVERKHHATDNYPVDFLARTNFASDYCELEAQYKIVPPAPRFEPSMLFDDALSSDSSASQEFDPSLKPSSDIHLFASDPDHTEIVPSHPPIESLGFQAPLAPEDRDGDGTNASEPAPDFEPSALIDNTGSSSDSTASQELGRSPKPSSNFPRYASDPDHTENKPLHSPVEILGLQALIVPEDHDGANSDASNPDEDEEFEPSF